MEYSRWNSLWPVNPFSSEQQINFIINNVDSKTQETLAKQINPDVMLSRWHIYGENNGLRKEEQCLTFWHLQDYSNTPRLSYYNVKDIYENDKWDLLGYTNTDQIQILKAATSEWLKQIEEKYS